MSDPSDDGERGDRRLSRSSFMRGISIAAGAASPNYKHGTPNGVTQTFTFTASRAGKYLIICPVRNHVKFGHWAWFIVSKTATKATAKITQ